VKFEPLTWADLQDTGNAQSQLVLIAVARHADWDAGTCYPSVRAIADMAKCSEKTARRHLKQLKTDGFIELSERFAESGERTSNLITLVGYAEWVITLRAGGGVARPKRAKRYRDDDLPDVEDAQPETNPEGCETPPPPGQSDQGPPVNLTRAPGHVLTRAPGHLVTRAKEHSLQLSSELSPQPPGASEGEGVLVLDGLEGLPAGTEHVRLCLARIATVLEIKHAKPAMLLAEIATALKPEPEPVLDELAGIVIRERKKIVSVKCVLDCLAKAHAAVPPMTIRDGDESYAAWVAHYANNRGMLSVARAHGFTVRSKWPPGFASRAVPAAPGAPAGRAVLADAAGRAVALGSEHDGGKP